MIAQDLCNLDGGLLPPPSSARLQWKSTSLSSDTATLCQIVWTVWAEKGLARFTEWSFSDRTYIHSGTRTHSHPKKITRTWLMTQSGICLLGCQGLQKGPHCLTHSAPYAAGIHVKLKLKGAWWIVKQGCLVCRLSCTETSEFDKLNSLSCMRLHRFALCDCCDIMRRRWVKKWESCLIPCTYSG